MELLFSYGTLQQGNVQLSTFGRKLNSEKAVLTGYITSEVEILDKGIVKVSGKRFHPILKETCREEDKVYGTIFEITSKELRCSDEHEVGSYIRKEVTLTSGKKAWIYTEKFSN